jgi:outer membrane protein assembly factor BamB
MHLALIPSCRRTRSVHSCAAAIAAMIVAAGAMTACSSNKPQANGSTPPSQAPANVAQGIDINHEAWAKIGYRLDWVGYPFGGNNRRVNVIGMAIRDDAVVLQEKSSTVTLMEATNGGNRWSIDVASPLTRFVDLEFDAADPSRVLVVSETELFTLDVATGNFSGRDDFQKVVNTSAVYDGGVAIFGTASGQVYAHNRVSGLSAWGFGLNATIDADPVRVGEMAVGVVSQGGEVIFLTPQGQLLGRARIFGGMDTDPVADEQRMYVAGLDQSLWAFTPTGQLAWRFRTPAALTVQPSTHDNVVYCEIPGSGLTAFDAGTGSVLWLAKDTSGTVIGQRNNRLVAWNGRTITTLDPRDGSVVERFDVPGIQRVEAQDFTDGVLYLVSSRGVVARMITR